MDAWRRPAGTKRAAAALAVLSLATGIAAGLGGVAQATTGQLSQTSSVAARHGMGFRRSVGTTVSPAQGIRALAAVGGRVDLLQAALPASVDLSRFDPPVANQGQVSSCAAWTVAYGMMGWFSRSQGHAGAPYAPMYVYSQVDGGDDGGSSPVQVLEVLRKQGVDTAVHYAAHHALSAYDWSHRPSVAEHANAAANKITGWISLYNTFTPAGSSAVTAVKQTLASGRPVALAIGVYQRFWDASGPGVFVASTGHNGPLIGFHEVLVVGYDSRGIRVENSWGTGWGDGGYATLDWNYVANHSYEAETIAGLAVTNNPGRPLVTALSRRTDPSTGRTYATLTGARLGSAIVSLGGNSVSAQSVSSDGRRLTFLVPPGPAGVVDPLRVSTPAGTAVGGPSTYTYTR